MLVLNHKQIEKKIHRLAFQVFEAFLEEEEVIIAGINGNGYLLAEQLHKQLTFISPLKCQLVEIQLDKHAPSAAGTQLSTKESLKGKPVVIVDDVLNTGRTMVYAVSAFIREGSSIIKTVVLADRNHRKFPVAADYVGISMATTLQEHLLFETKGGDQTLVLV